MTNALVAGIFFGIIGSGYVLYGRKAHNWVALGAGVLLCVFPYFVDTLVATLLVGLVLVAVPFVVTP